MSEITDAQRAFLRELWEISPELHDWCAKRFREGASLETVREQIRHASNIRTQ